MKKPKTMKVKKASAMVKDGGKVKMAAMAPSMMKKKKGFKA